MRFSRFAQCWVCFVLSLLLVSGCHRFLNRLASSLSVVEPPIVTPEVLAGHTLVPLVQPGPWPDITGLIGYGDRLWFANSVAFGNHNSADVYSYAPATGQTRYERHLFSQSVGKPAVADGLLYWPFEDPRFSADLGEYMVTNGEDWQWRLFPNGEAFHVHTMAAQGDSLFAGTGAWAGRLQRSQDGGQTWQVIYEHPTPDRQVSRVTQLAVLDEQLYVGITARQEAGIKLLRWDQEMLQTIDSWPRGKRVSDLTTYDGWLYGINLNPDDSTAIWRTHDQQTEPVEALNGYPIRALAAGSDALWAVSSNEAGGFLWHSSDGVAWTAAQQFQTLRPLDVAVYAGNVYVGARDEGGRGVLLGPTAPESAGEATSTQMPTIQAVSPSPQQLQAMLNQLDEVMANRSSYANGNTQDVLSQTLKPLAISSMPEVGEALSQRLGHSPPQVDATLFDDVVTEPATDVLQWYLLWAIALNGHGQIPVELLAIPWTTPSNSREKYWQPVPAAAWAVAQLGQADVETLAALINRLSFKDDPIWLKGDFIGALSALTGEQFGYDQGAWQTWWAQQANDFLNGVSALS
ncbi:MAG: hypothetical protein AAFX95_01185 [Cyanobacteria bacterium J06639_16]